MANRVVLNPYIARAEDICPICTLEYSQETADLVSTVCGHVFHENCVRPWAETRGTCPMCRRNLIPLNPPVAALPRTNEQRLLEASIRDDVPTILNLLAVPGINVNALDSLGNSVLIYAARHGRIEIISQLLTFPYIDINHLGQSFTALAEAILNGHAKCTDLLFAKPDIDPNPKDHYDTSLLGLAAEKGLVYIVERLLTFPNIDINHLGQYHTPLTQAIANENVKCAAFLLGRPDIDPNAVDQSGTNPLTWAAQKGQVDIVRRLLTFPRIDARHKGQIFTPLEAARISGNPEVLALIQDFLSKHPA